MRWVGDADAGKASQKYCVGQPPPPAAGCVVVGLTTSMTASAMREAGCAATVRDWSEVTAEFLQGLLA